MGLVVREALCWPRDTSPALSKQPPGSAPATLATYPTEEPFLGEAKSVRFWKMLKYVKNAAPALR